jgi:hydroxycarboxylate dehydrogenase B
MTVTTHTIALPRLNDAIRQVVAGFGSSAEEVDAVAGNLI